MEATLNVNVKVGLEEATIQKIATIFAPRPAGIEARPAQGPRPSVPEKPQAEPAPEAEEPVDNMTLMNAVKAAKDAGKADAIRELFAKYGIASSRDCPQEKRRDLLKDLNSL